MNPRTSARSAGRVADSRAWDAYPATSRRLTARLTIPARYDPNGWAHAASATQPRCGAYRLGLRAGDRIVRARVRVHPDTKDRFHLDGDRARVMVPAG